MFDPLILRNLNLSNLDNYYEEDDSLAYKVEDQIDDYDEYNDDEYEDDYDE